MPPKFKNKKLFEKLSLSWTNDSTRLFVDPTPLSNVLPYRIQEVGNFKTYYPYYTERKNLQSIQLIYTLNGEGRLNYLGKNYIITPGQCFILDCSIHHTYYTPKDKTWNFLWVHFWGTAAQLFIQEIIENGPIVLNVQNQFKLETTLLRILMLNQNKPIGYEAISSHLADSILTDFLIQQIAQSQPHITLAKDIEKIIKFIEENFKSPISLDLLAKSYNFSKFYLSRKFKSYTRSTINEYIIKVRLNHSKQLLRETDYTISQIAFESGINNVTHFINLFKKREGMTPLIYRKMWLNTDN